MEVSSFILLILIALGGGAGYLGWKGRYQIKEGHVGLVWRWHLLGSDPKFPRITPNGRHGWQAVTLAEGRRGWYPPGFYKIEHVPWTYVPPDQIGLVTAREGRQRDRGHAFGLLNKGADDAYDFQDGAAFLRKGGQQGLQATVLPGGQSYKINTKLFEVTLKPRTSVPQGSIGLVIAKAGRIPPPGQLYGQPVACDNFQDGQTFLEQGGEQGRQLAVLAGGAMYDINPELFDVVTEHNVESHGGGLTADHLRLMDIPVDHTGVVITLVGKRPAWGSGDSLGPVMEGHAQFQEPGIFLAGGGHQGVQTETLNEGVYQLNPWFVRVVLVPTRVITLEWSAKAPSDQDNFDVELTRLAVTIQGYSVEMDLMQSLRISKDAAPKLVKEFGGQLISPTHGLGGLVNERKPIQRFVERILGATVTTYLSRTAAETTIREFLNRHRDVSMNLTAQIRKALMSQGVEADSTHLGLFEPDERLREELRKEGREELEQGRLQREKEIAKQRDEIHEIENRRVKRELGNDLEVLIEQLGRDNAIAIQLIREMSNVPVPATLMAGDLSDIAKTLPMTQVTRLFDGLREQAGKQLAPNEQQARISSPPKFLLNPDSREFAVALVLCEPWLRDPDRTAPPPSPQQIADTIMEVLDVLPGLGIRDHFIQEANARLKALRSMVRRADLISASQQLTTAALPSILLDHGVLVPHHRSLLQDRDWLDYQAELWKEFT